MDADAAGGHCGTGDQLGLHPGGRAVVESGEDDLGERLLELPEVAELSGDQRRVAVVQLE
jgi:hypothetical protein